MLFRRLEPPRTAAGAPDYRPPAMVFAAVMAVALMLTSFHMALASQLFHDHRRTAYALVCAATMVPFLALYAVAHRILARFGLYMWQSLTVGLVALYAMSAAPSWAEAVFPRVHTRYERELSGPGRCLFNSPYRLDRAQTTYPGPERNQMLIDPIEDGHPKLRLDNAVDGGLRHLKPADASSRQILTAYGC